MNIPFERNNIPLDGEYDYVTLARALKRARKQPNSVYFFRTEDKSCGYCGKINETVGRRLVSKIGWDKDKKDYFSDLIYCEPCSIKEAEKWKTKTVKTKIDVLFETKK